MGFLSKLWENWGKGLNTHYPAGPNKTIENTYRGYKYTYIQEIHL